ncbi:MAG: PAS domain-containing protein [Nitrospira sp.]
MATGKKTKATGKKVGTKSAGGNDLAGKVQAIDRAQAVIEFNLDGTVITANDNFLRTLGYTLDEIKDKHHRMFCDAAYTDSPEYANFWAKVNRGEFDAGAYKRVGKGGKEVWMQAICTPVLGADGRPTKVIEIATDVTAQHQELDDLHDELKARTDIMNTTSIVSEADLKGDIVWVNEKFIEVSKYPKNELVGKGHNTTRHPDMPKEAFKDLWGTIGRGQIWRGVVKNRAKDGTPYYVDAVIAPFLGKNGKPRKYLGVRYDITVQEIARQNMKGVADAIDKSYACIEFNLDGTVITANENFLKTLGYTLAEIKGHHHRMFCDADYTATGEYTAFWAKLNRGEFDAGIYKRIGKGGKEVWIQASYNPVKDEMGRTFKVVKFATDITADKIRNADFEGKMAAVSKAQAVIEFNMDGTAITANDNFLNTLGYSLDEIKGKHHRMFCEPAYTNSPEYQAFWAKLNRGEFDAGTYRRIGKGGKEVWIQASYNPIMDASGKPLKVVKFATDITGQKQAQLEVEKLIAAAAVGQLKERIKTDRFEGASKALTQSFNQLLDAVAIPLDEAKSVLSALAANDLTKAMTGAYQGDFEQMKTSLNAAIANLTETLSTVRTAAESVSIGAEQITKGNEDLSQRTSEQASSLEETSSAMEEMTSTVKQNADNAKQANQLAITARDVAQKGGEVTTKAINAMGEINKSSKKIADIITVIDEIAFQTNLLALNAAVEAARAGEHGRGFAVVAAEVRNLAQRSATAAKEIKGLINESVQRVTDGSELVNQSGKTLEEIVSSVKRVTDIIAEITAASQEQASGIEQVNKAIMQMDETTQQNAALVEEATSASQSMKEQARELMGQVASFQLTQTGQEIHQRPSAAPTAHRPSALSAGPVKKPLLKKPAPAAKPEEAKKLVGVSADNGKERRQKDSEFEEF